MKRRIQLFMLFLSLGLFLAPKNTLHANTLLLDCCNPKLQTEQSCHENLSHENHHSDSKQEKTSKESCDSHCCVSCGSCTHSVSSLFKPVLAYSIPLDFTQTKAKGFSYNSVAKNNDQADIWQPPKILS